MDHQLIPVIIGRTLGHYRIVEKIGAGGMGVVYRAHDEQLDRAVAIKVLPASDFSDPAARQRLVREARIASKLNHPNICTIHDAGEAGGETYIAMELLDGQALSARLASGPLEPETILHYGTQLADALGHAHARGVVHRDLKSANVIVTPDDRVKILDFGLAKLVVADESATATTELQRTLTKPGILAGTLSYMAPEQLRGLAADARSDIWAFGVMLYEMAAGRRPFGGVTGFEVTAAILSGSPEPLSNRVPKHLAGLIAKCLEKDPDQRYQRVDEIQSALHIGGSKQAVASQRPPVLTSRGIAAIGVAALATALAAAAALDVGNMRRWATGFLSADVVAFAERDWLLVANFENQTTDRVFDQSLDTALTVGMGQSSYVNIVPTSRIQGALRRMKIPVQNQVDGATARHIAQREGLRLVLVPRIAEVGGVYQLSGSLEDPVTGAVLKSAIVRARRKEDVLDGVDQLIGRIRNDLGEAERSISQQGKPLAQVTTSSLEALKVFSQARETYTAARIDEALALYEEALRLDPSFTSARAQVGMIHFELRDREKGKGLIAESIQHVDGLTDKERYSILAFHASAVENNPSKAIDYYTALLALYPDAGAAHNNVGRAYMQMGRWDEAVAALKRALRLDPDTMLTYNSLNQIYLYHLSDLDSAVELSRQQLAYNDQSEYAYDSLGWAMLGKGDLVQAREAFQKALTINPRATLALFRLGHTYRLEGRYRDARDTFLKVPMIDSADPSAYYDAGVASHLMGDGSAARINFLKARQLVEMRIRGDSRSASTYLELATVLARLGEDLAAASAADRGMALDSNQHFDYARFLSLQGSRADAIRHLQLAVERGFTNFVWMKIHEDLEALAVEPGFQTLIADNLKP